MKPGSQDDLLGIIQIIRSAPDEEALLALQGVIHEANEKGYAAGLAEATSGGPVTLSPDQQRAFTWASHQRNLALRRQAVEDMKKANTNPDLVQAATALIEVLQSAQLLLMGLETGDIVLFRVRDGSTLDCFRFDPA